MDKPKKTPRRSAPIVEMLEPRMLFSADSLSAIGGVLLPEDTVTQSTLNDLYPELTLPHPLDSDAISDANAGVELVFIDSRVPDLQSIVDDITANKSTSVLVVVVDKSDSGIELVSETLAQFDSVDAVHIVSHSLGSGVRLGSDFLASTTIAQSSDQLQSWADSLSANADLLIYGCDLASSEHGLALMNQLATFTGADVASSTNDTGHASQNGDWLLEASTGAIETATLVSASLQNQWDHVLADWTAGVLTIDFTNDQYLFPGSERYDSIQSLVDHAALNSGGDISLREAIVAANNEPTGTVTIQLTGATYSIDIPDITGDEDDSFTGDLDVQTSITIVGDSAATTILNADTSDNVREMRVLDVHAGATVTLSDLTVKGGMVDDLGGGIRVSNAALNLTNVVVEDNATTFVDPLGGTDGGIGGGGIYALNSAIIANNSHIFNNSTSGSGGGIYIDGGAGTTLNQVSVDTNFALDGNGGGVYTNAELNVNDQSDFTDNEASQGGGIYVDNGSTTTIQSSKLVDNIATDVGGGLVNAGLLYVVEESTIMGNTATNYGGGIHTITNTNIEDSTIDGNRAINEDGGGIQMSNGVMHVVDSLITNNRAENGKGGGINGVGDVVVYQSTIAGNNADFGGGIHHHSYGSPDIVNSTVFNNQATTDGGGIYYSAGNGYIENSTIVGNHADGLYGAIGIPGVGVTATLRNSIISDNTADNNNSVPGGDSQQLAIGTTSGNEHGFNVIEQGTDAETNFATRHNDIIAANLPGYTVDAKLGTVLENFNGSHSQHFSLELGSDAIDAGGKSPLAAGPKQDAYGLETNQFIDAGAVEYQSATPAKKLYWINNDLADSAIYRMNEDGSALQKIVAQSDLPDSPLPDIFTDVAFDPKTNQLFYIRIAGISDPGNGGIPALSYHVMYATADGYTTANTHLATMGMPAGGTVMVGDEYFTTALYVEETPNPLDPNVLYLAQRKSGDGTTRLITFDINAGIDVGGTPNIWLPMITNGFVNDASVPNPPLGGLTVETIGSLNVVSDLSNPGTSIISWADTGDSATFDYVAIKDGTLTHQINVTSNDTGLPAPNDQMEAIVSTPNGDFFFVVTKDGVNKLISATNTLTGLLPHPTGGQFNDIEYDELTDRVWYADSTGSIGALDSDLALVKSMAVTQQPFSLTMAKMSSVNTPPRLTSTSPASLTVDENGTVLIDTSVLAATDVGENGASNADELFYTITKLPGDGNQLIFTPDGGPAQAIDLSAPIPPNGHFTQDDIDNDRVQYVQTGDENPVDSFEFILSDGTATSEFIAGVVNITVTPVNDAPEFVAPPTDLQINENTVSDLRTTLGAVMSGIVTTDAEGNNVSLEVFEGTDLTPSTRFSIDGATGVISLSPGIDYEAEVAASGTDVIALNIVATDDDPISPETVSTVVNVTIGDLNEAPAFNSPPTDLYINENTTGLLKDVAGADMGGIQTIDEDDGDVVTLEVFEDTDVTPSTQFSIDSATGLISLNPAIDYETLVATASANPILLRVVATDDDATPISTTTSINVHIGDVNEAPTFTSPPTDLYIDENTTGLLTDVAGADMAGIQTTDEDDSDVVTLAVFEGADVTPSTQFSIDSATGLISLNPAIDYETLVATANANPIVLRVVATDDDATPISTTTSINVHIGDVNEAPTFTTPPTDLYIDENATGLLKDVAGADMGGIQTTDEDDGDVVTLEVFENTDVTPSTQFSIDSATGLISLNPAIDYETLVATASANPILLRVVATDDDATPLSTVTAINIHIADVNEAPAFDSPPTDLYIDENTTGVLTDVAGADMAGIQTTDEDDSDVVTLAVFEGADVTPSTQFSIDSATGLISLNPAIDYETLVATANANPIVLRVVATDDDATPLSTTTTINVHVGDVNEAPTFNTPPTDLYINENTMGLLKDVAGADMNGIQTIDEDDGDVVTLEVFEGADVTPSTQFSIDSATGLISLNPAIDYETLVATASANPIILRVVATDDDATPLSAVTTINIHIADVNEAPAFTSPPSDLYIDENTTGVLTDVAGADMAGIQTTDEDDGDVVTLEVFENTDVTPSTQFSIDSATGLISLNPAIDYETLVATANANPIVLRVVATDDDATPLSTTTSINVHVGDVNEAPTFNTPPTDLYIDENTIGLLKDVAGADMSGIQTIDEDDSDVVTLEVFEGADVTPSTQFSIDSATGLISLNPAIDYETLVATASANPILLRVVATDDDATPLSAVTTINIHIADVNEAPAFSSPPSDLYIDEGITGVLTDVAGADMAGIQTTDEDDSDVVTLEVFEGADVTPSTQFSIDSATGLISLNPVIDYETLVATANANPIILRVVATDDDATPLSTITAINIHIADVNEAPAFTSPPSDLYIDEGTTGVLTDVAGVDMTGIQTIDEDDSDVVTLEVFEGADVTLSTQFSIDSATGLISLNPAIDYETLVATASANPIILRVVATDDDATPLSAVTAINIHIADVNEAPAFDSPPSDLYIDENTTGVLTDVAGADMAGIQFNDEDDGDVVTLEVFENTDVTPSTQFSIDSATGLISLNPAIDYETLVATASANPIILRVVATDDDSTPISTTTSINVHIGDVNEAPTFTSPPSDLYIDEGTTGVLTDVAGVDMTGIQTIDEDDGDVVTLEVFENTDVTPSTQFSIDSATGLISLNPAIDYETLVATASANPILLRVVATDDDATPLSTVTTINIHIADVNEAPAFTSPPSDLYIDENTTGVLTDVAGADMVGIQTTDEDAGDVVTLEVFEGANSTVSTQFSIDSTTGLITLNTGIDYETLAASANANPIVLRVVATDDGPVPMSSTTPINVHIGNMNEAPVINYTDSILQIDENESGIVLTGPNTPMPAIQIADPDINDNLILQVYEGIELSTRFSVVNNRIVVASADGLDAETLVNNPITLTIRVSDRADASALFHEVDVVVTVNNLNEAPVITTPTGPLQIDENVQGIVLQASGAPMNPILVNDQDVNDNVTLQVFEGNTVSTRFGMDVNNRLSVISANGLDADGLSNSITLTIRASDRADASALTDEVDVIVTINNVNEAPIIDSAATTLQIDENQAGALFSGPGIPMPAILASDPDENDNLTLQVFEGGVESNRFRIDENNFITIISDAGLDADTLANNPITLTIRASDRTDASALTDEVDVAVTINPLNESPIIIQAPTALEIDENQTGVLQSAPDVQMAPIQTTDPDAGDNVTLQVFEGAIESSRFSIDANNRITLNTSAGLDADTLTANPITLTIRASDRTDATALIDEVDINVTINELNEAPTGITIVPTNNLMNVPELAPEYVLGRLSTSDPDSGDTNPIYTIMGEGNQSRFEVTADGDLKLKQNQMLDFEVEQQITISIQSEDRRGGSIVVPFTFDVSNVNEQPTAALPVNLFVDENSTGTISGPINAVDPDNTEPNVSLVVLDSEHSADFVLNSSTNQIELVNQLDHESGDTVLLRVDVSDQSLTSSYQITVHIQNVNEAPEFISEPEAAALTLSESATFDLSSIVFTDPDSTNLTTSVALVSTVISNPDTDAPDRTLTIENTGDWPDWLIFSPSSNTLTISNPPTGTTGVYVDIAVNDGENTATHTVFMSIASVPELAPAQEAPVTQTELSPVDIPEPETDTVFVVAKEEPEEVPAKEGETVIDSDLASGESDESVDLSSLIKPLEQVNLIELGTADNTIRSIGKKIILNQLDGLDNAGNWLNLSDAFSVPSDIEFTELASEFDRQREELAEQLADTKTLIGSSFTISSGLSVGYLLWLIRGGTLMGSVLSSLPAWRLVDPLPVLGSLGEDFEDDDESLESMVDSDDGDTPDQESPKQAA